MIIIIRAKLIKFLLESNFYFLRVLCYYNNVNRNTNDVDVYYSNRIILMNYFIQKFNVITYLIERSKLEYFLHVC